MVVVEMKLQVLFSFGLTLGDILFGGVDYGRLDGSLVTLPMLRNEKLEYYGYSITMDHLYYDRRDIGTQEFEKNRSYVVTLDSGWPYITFPHNLAHLVARSMYGYVDDEGFIVVPCQDKYIKHFGGLHFNFTEAEIVVDWRDVVREPEYRGELICHTYLNSKEGIDSIMLGLPFLKEAYVVHDLVRFVRSCD
jgi:Eukaryotic aspartyl protease